MQEKSAAVRSLRWSVWVTIIMSDAICIAAAEKMRIGCRGRQRAAGWDGKQCSARQMSGRMESDIGQQALEKVVEELESRTTSDVNATYVLVEQTIQVTLDINMNDKKQLIIESTINTDGVGERCVVDRCYVYTESAGFTQEETLPDMWGG